jgi:CheY-like chemotaxis protein
MQRYTRFLAAPWNDRGINLGFKAAADPDHRGHLLCAQWRGEEGASSGCDDYVPKPFSPRQLLAKIRQHLS